MPTATATRGALKAAQACKSDTRLLTVDWSWPVPARRAPLSTWRSLGPLALAKEGRWRPGRDDAASPRAPSGMTGKLAGSGDFAVEIW